MTQPQPQPLSLHNKSLRFHGTAFCTLSLMSMLAEPDKNAIIPYGSLEQKGIPCLVGECVRGLEGVNQRGTSWTSCYTVSKNYATGSHHPFAGGSRHTIEKSKLKLKGAIEEYELVFIKKGSVFFHYPRENYDWKIMVLAVRRLRMLNDEEFKQLYLDGLLKWARAIIEENKKIDVNERSIYMKETADDLIKTVEHFISELDKPLLISATTDQARQALQDLTPIVFATTEINESEAYEPGSDEYVVKRSMKLGKEISYIFTTNDGLARVKEHLLQHDLLDKVVLCSFDVMDNFIAEQRKIKESLATIMKHIATERNRVNVWEDSALKTDVINTLNSTEKAFEEAANGHDSKAVLQAMVNVIKESWLNQNIIQEHRNMFTQIGRVLMNCLLFLGYGVTLGQLHSWGMLQDKIDQTHSKKGYFFFSMKTEREIAADRAVDDITACCNPT